MTAFLVIGVVVLLLLAIAASGSGNPGNQAMTITDRPSANSIPWCGGNSAGDPFPDRCRRTPPPTGRLDGQG